MRSFKSNENIYKKEGGSYYVVSANKASSLLMLKQSKDVGKRMETAVLYHPPIFLPLYNPPSSPSDEDRQNWIIDPFI